MFLFENNYFYYITLGLQAICAIHCIRRGNQNKWIWIIVFLPLIGSIAYIFTEMFSRNDVQNVQSGIGSVLFPSARIKKLENNLRFTDTFNNRVLLADAYLEEGMTDKAIALYEESFKGNFTGNEHLIKQLIIAYSKNGRYGEVVPLAEKIYHTPQFARSKVHILYALALENTANTEKAEKEFQAMKGKFSNYEARYHYGLFLIRLGRKEEAQILYKQLLEEVQHLSGVEKKSNRQWFSSVKDELNKMKA